MGYRLRDSDLVPVMVFRRLEDRGLLLGNDLSAKLGCIDVLYLGKEDWMVSQEFDRRELQEDAVGLPSA